MPVRFVHASISLRLRTAPGRRDWRGNTIAVCHGRSSFSGTAMAGVAERPGAASGCLRAHRCPGTGRMRGAAAGAGPAPGDERHASTGRLAPRGLAVEVFFEPMVGVALVVECRDLGV